MKQQVEAVQELLTRKNLSVNSASQRWRLDRNTLAKFANGGLVTTDWLERFADRTGEDLNRWRALLGYAPLAGYEPVGAAPAEASGVEILDAGMYQLSQRVGRLLPYNGHINRETLTPAEARRQLADIEAELREEGLLTD